MSCPPEYYNCPASVQPWGDMPFVPYGVDPYMYALQIIALFVLCVAIAVGTFFFVRWIITR